MRRWGLAAFLGILLIGSSARANVLTIEFDFTASTFTALGISIPPSGQIVVASLNLSMPALGSSTPIASPAVVDSFLVGGTIDVTLGLFTMITGLFVAGQVGTGYGTFNAAGGTVLITRDFTIMGALQADCFGLLCLGIFPITIGRTQSANETIFFPINNISIPGSATIMTDVTLTFNGIEALLEVVGEEVTRSVPEPDGALGLAAGLAGLAGAWWLRGRRSVR